MKLFFAVLVTMFVVIGGLAQSPKGSGLSSQEVIDRLWKKATAGELLTTDGWNRASGFSLTWAISQGTTRFELYRMTGQ
jgi:hypothetical protein